MSNVVTRGRIEANPKRVRGLVAGQGVVDTTGSVFVWEHPYYPAWYVPIADVAGELHPNGTIKATDDRGEGRGHDLNAADRTVEGAAWIYPDAPDASLRDLVRLEWSALDQWFEEDVEVFVHPRSPYVRIDALPSSRRVEVRVDGTVLAASSRPTILYETGLPPRYYLPQLDVRMDLLTPTDTSTACPYKGWANYWTVAVDGVTHDDAAWSYRTPLPESEPIAGLVCFYDDKVDIRVDGKPTAT